MRISVLSLKATVLCALLLFVGTTPASASTIQIGIGAFGGGSTLTTFVGLPTSTEVNGLSVDGIGFAYSLGSGHVIIDGGPGITNNVAPQNVVSTGNPAGIVTMTLPGYVGSFGFGFALLESVSLANAVTVSIFDGVTLVGSEVYAGAVDPTFTGGFAGIQSTIPFNSVRVVFSATAPAWALDDVRTATAGAAAVPEPSTWLLLGTGLAAVAARRRFTKRA